jgi:SNF2-related domain
MIEGTSDQNDEVLGRLHGIIRPFILRRLKKDVETQMPGKYEHIIKCQLSRRQVRHRRCIAPASVLALILTCISDVNLRRVHGSFVDTSSFEEGGQFPGNDECVDAASKGLQSPGSVRAAVGCYFVCS